MRPKKNWVLTAVIFAAILIAAVVYHTLKNSRQEKEGAVPAPNARAANVLNVNGYILKEQPLTDIITASAFLLPDEEVNLTFQTSGKITNINFEEGTAVKKGDLLAKVNDKPLQAQLSRYLAQKQLAEDRVSRQSSLLEKDAVSQEAYEQAVTELAVLQADIDLVRANIELTELRAPFDGIIGLRNVSEGAYASPSITVATLTKFSPLKLDFGINEKYSADVKQGTKLTFTIEGIQKTFDATVYATESQVDQGTMSLSVRALFPNERMEVLPGRYASVRIQLVELNNALVIPSQAIIPEMGISKVFLYRDGIAEPVDITAGLRTDAQVQVVSGLNVGDTIITSGTLQLRMGMKVVLDNVE